MGGTSKLVVVWLVVAACGAGDNRIDPGDLELRDLLGVSPDVATGWDASQRTAARRVIVAGLRDADAPAAIEADPGAIGDERITHALAALDARRFAAGDAALGVVRVDDLVATPRVAPTAAAAIDANASPKLELRLDHWDAWPQLPGRGLGVLGAIAVDAGHTTGPVVIAPAARLPAIAVYVGDRLLVNPVVLAALEPEPGEVAVIARTPATPATPPTAPVVATAAGNPYSFYGSVEECAAAQRSRCEACLPASNCLPITNATDGNAECTMLAANDGRGYFLECINMALAITGVSACAQKDAPSCPRNTNAADSLTDLESNAKFLDDVTCGAPLDNCLAKIYGTPSGTFPGLVDGGTAPPPPPRNTSVNCGDSCGSKNENCTASPNCSCSGPSCNNSLSCDSACSSSNHQSGCGDACSSTSSSSGGGGSCSGGSSSGGSSNNCGSCSGGSSSGGSSNSCGSCGSSSSSSSSSCGSCGGSSSSSSSGCGGSSGGKCSVASGEPSAGFALAASIVWGFMPVPFAAVVRRRARKRKRKPQHEEVAP